jgi:hypothetical protein
MTTNYLTNYLKDRRTLAQLKQTAKERGIVPTGNKSLKATWVEALDNPASVPAAKEEEKPAAKEEEKIQPKAKNLKITWSLKELKSKAEAFGLVVTGDKRFKTTYIIALGLG